MLVLGRAVQGLGAALMAPAALALLITAFPQEAARDRALGLWSAAGSVGIPAGALLGGMLTATLGWRWVLLVNVPAAGLAALASSRVLPESRDRSAPRRLDVPGAVLVTAGLALLVLAIVQTAGVGGLLPRVGVPLAGAAVLLAALLVVERRARVPLVPLPVLRAPGLLAANLVGASLPVGLGALLFLATLYLQQVLALTPLRTGLAYLALALPVIAASPVASLLVSRYGRRRIAVLGLCLQAVGLLVIARVPADGAVLTDVLPGFVIVGVGAPVAFVPATAAVMTAGGKRSGLASGIFTTAQQVGNAVALASLATVAATRTDGLLADGISRPVALAGGYRAGFLLAAALAGAGTLAALRLPDGDGGTAGRAP